MKPTDKHIQLITQIVVIDSGSRVRVSEWKTSVFITVRRYWIHVTVVIWT